MAGHKDERDGRRKSNAGLTMRQLLTRNPAEHSTTSTCCHQPPNVTPERRRTPPRRSFQQPASGVLEPVGDFVQHLAIIVDNLARDTLQR